MIFLQIGVLEMCYLLLLLVDQKYCTAGVGVRQKSDKNRFQR